MAVVEFDENDRRSFLKLTEDSAIREAAYPLSEWVANGGSSERNKGLVNDYRVAYRDEPPEIVKFGGLLSPPDSLIGKVKQNPDNRAKNIALYRKKIESHTCYRLLLSDTNFTSAQTKFKKQQKRAGQSSKLNSEFADFRFARIIANVIGLQLLCEKVGYRPAYADAKLLLRAKGYVSKLRNSIKEGVWLSDMQEQRNLDRLLEQFLLEINVAPRKEKVTETSEKRKCLETVAFVMKLKLDLLSPTILSDLAAMLIWHPDHTAIDKVVKSTKEKYERLEEEKRKALAQALLKTPAQNG